MKKIFTILPVIALALLLASPAMAWWSSDDVNISSTNNAAIFNETDSESDTGDNVTRIKGGSGTGYIATGAAESLAESHVTANTNMTSVSAPCDCYDDVTIGSHNTAHVFNVTGSKSETGDNKTMVSGNQPFRMKHERGSDRHPRPTPSASAGTVITGPAYSAAGSWVAVNTNVTSFGGN